MKTPARFAHFAAGLLLSLLLVTCGRGQAISVTIVPAADTGVGCFLQLQIAPTAVTPVITAAQAEIGARTAYDAPTLARLGRLAELQEARLVTVIASGSRTNGQDALRGQDVWLLVFAYVPTDQPSTLPVGTGRPLRWTAYSLVSAADGSPLISCTSPL